MMLRSVIAARSRLSAGRRCVHRALSVSFATSGIPRTTRSPSELEQLGASLATRRRPGDVIFLRG
jgi:hypothetical protein